MTQTRRRLCIAAFEFDMNDGWRPSNPNSPAPQVGSSANCEFSINLGSVQSCRSRLVAVE
jgi:hypothetical protein